MLSLHVTMTPFLNESRLLKQVKAILAQGLVEQVLILALWEEGLPEHEELEEGLRVYRVKLWTRRLGRSLVIQVLKYIELCVRARALAWRHEAKVVDVHALALLPLGWLIKSTSSAQLIYNPHELETERAGLNGFRKRASKWVERAFIGTADCVVVVGELIKQHYLAMYGALPITTVMNCPPASVSPISESPLRSNLGIGENAEVFIYQGLLDHGRGIERVLEAFTRLDQDHQACLVFMGYGPMEAVIRSAAESSDSIYLHPPVAPHEVKRHTAGADIGLCFIEPICLSYEYALPNKLFEYLSCGLQVIASDLPEIRLHSEGLANVHFVTDDTPSALVDAMCDALGNSRGAHQVRLPRRYSWEEQSEVMIHAYRTHLNVWNTKE